MASVVWIVILMTFLPCWLSVEAKKYEKTPDGRKNLCSSKTNAFCTYLKPDEDFGETCKNYSKSLKFEEDLNKTCDFCNFNNCTLESNVVSFMFVGSWPISMYKLPSTSEHAFKFQTLSFFVPDTNKAEFRVRIGALYWSSLQASFMKRESGTKVVISAEMEKTLSHKNETYDMSINFTNVELYPGNEDTTTFINFSKKPKFKHVLFEGLKKTEKYLLKYLKCQGIALPNETHSENVTNRRNVMKCPYVS